jgi:hypothetical protein
MQKTVSEIILTVQMTCITFTEMTFIPGREAGEGKPKLMAMAIAISLQSEK